MANHNEQILRLWDKWVAEENGQEEATEGYDPDDFVDWAIKNNKIVLPPEDYRKLMRRRVTTALRQEVRTNEKGMRYRAKQCVTDGQRVIWFDLDQNSTPNLCQKAAKQRRDAIVNDVYRGYCDITHMRELHPQEQIAFHLDFTEDVEERAAQDIFEYETSAD